MGGWCVMSFFFFFLHVAIHPSALSISLLSVIFLVWFLVSCLFSFALWLNCSLGLFCLLLLQLSFVEWTGMRVIVSVRLGGRGV